ncbi:hypothetical protein ABIE78_003928 [Sinorhizobium fredii]|jgi:hypothetical protein|uniref:Uncharacterized protein n=1 Tax=Sinorhizobium fredii (strain USDA 257) TaxID=1185652 RepID=I3X318_SINF2|nr:hypothetical protein [Sinorhizobium fredii]AFL50274.1 hypothetical protein USDA257_c16860 [Sinorhizobium fredii USDA 257]
MRGLSRRAVLGLAGGGLASTALAYAAVRSFSEEDLVRATLRKYLDDVTISDDHLRAFTLEFKKRNPWDFPTEKLADATTLFEGLRLGGMARPLLPADDAMRLERFERWLLTEFHLLTDYAWRGGPNEPVTFSGSQHCVNPFANFETA